MASWSTVKAIGLVLLIAGQAQAAKAPDRKAFAISVCAAVDKAATTIRYDSDSFQIAIDNCGTSCFTNSMKDFVGKPFPSSTKVLGIGRATSTYVGTVRWLIVDDAGRRHELLLPGTRFQAGLPFRLSKSTTIRRRLA